MKVGKGWEENEEQEDAKEEENKEWEEVDHDINDFGWRRQNKRIKKTREGVDEEEQRLKKRTRQKNEEEE